MPNYQGVWSLSEQYQNASGWPKYVVTKALLGGGYAYPASPTNSIEYFTIASTGNGTDFGDLTLAAYRISGCSNAHGGLQ